MSKKFYDMPQVQRTEDAFAAEDLIRRERDAWNNMHWADMADCYAATSRLKFHLYDGDAKAYCEAKAKEETDAQALYRQPVTDIRSIKMWQNDCKMIAEVPAVVVSLHTVSGIEYKLESRVRLYYSLVKENGCWKIFQLAPLYEQDSLQPTLPVAAPLAAQEDFAKLHAAHKGFSWLMAKAGTPVGRLGLVGLDRPLMVTEMYEDLSIWFYQEKTLPMMFRWSRDEMMVKVKRIGELEKTEAPSFEQDAPVEIREIYDALLADYDAARAKYFEKRITVTGVICKIAPDTYGAPSLDLGDGKDSRCYALMVFHKPGQKEQCDQLQVGQRAVIRGNIVNFMEPYGAVIKNVELLDPQIEISTEKSV